MEQPFNLSIKNRQQKAENMWAPPTFNQSSSFAQKSSFIDQNNQTAYIYALLLLESNCKRLGQNCKKLLAKQKRQALRKIFDFTSGPQSANYPHFASNPAYLQRGKKEFQNNARSHDNPETGNKEMVNLCMRDASHTLDKLVYIVNQKRVRLLLRGFAALRVSQVAAGQDKGRQGISPSRYELENNSKLMGNASRTSNKRKTTRTRTKNEEVKQNSQYNSSQLSVENQKLESELISEELQREQFAERMHELLDYHEKILLQGSTTTRTKKNK